VSNLENLPVEERISVYREHAAREQWNVVGTYHDAAISGASVILRPESGHSSRWGTALLTG